VFSGKKNHYEICQINTYYNQCHFVLQKSSGTQRLEHTRLHASTLVFFGITAHAGQYDFGPDGAIFNASSFCQTLFERPPEVLKVKVHPSKTCRAKSTMLQYPALSLFLVLVVAMSAQHPRSRRLDLFVHTHRDSIPFGLVLQTSEWTCTNDKLAFRFL